MTKAVENIFDFVIIMFTLLLLLLFIAIGLHTTACECEKQLTFVDNMIAANLIINNNNPRNSDNMTISNTHLAKAKQ